MATTFLALTNKCLRRTNDAQLTSASFTAATGFHAFAKDAVNLAISEINVREFQWPFNKQNGSQTLVSGTNLYTFPSTTKVVDWDSFYLEKDDALEVTARKLGLLTFDEWNLKYRSNDDNNFNAASITIPSSVFPTQTNFGWGVTPKPDRAYTVTYDYWDVTEDLSLATDTPAIPNQYDYVIYHGAMMYIYAFREDNENAAGEQRKFEDGIGAMRTILTNKYEKVSDTRVFTRERRFNYGWGRA